MGVALRYYSDKILMDEEEAQVSYLLELRYDEGTTRAILMTNQPWTEETSYIGRKFEDHEASLVERRCRRVDVGY